MQSRAGRGGFYALAFFDALERMVMQTYYDLSHELDENTYHPYGFAGFRNLQMFPSHGCRHATVTMSLHFGTHIYAPWHMIASGKRLDAISISELIGEALVVDLSGDYGPPNPRSREISRSDVQKAIEKGKLDLKAGDALIIYTGWAPLFKAQPTFYYGQYCVLSGETCEWLVKARIRLVGLDAPDLDLPTRYVSTPFNPVNHVALLGNNIYAIENVGGEILKIMNQRVVLIPAPTRFAGEYASGAPVRLLATNIT
jgi:arylformamidase